jgi:TolB-like protein/Flp pilus assembly protein TadD
MAAILHEDPPPLGDLGSGVPAGVEAIVRRCLEKEPGERFQSARDLAFNLRAVSSGTPAEPTPPGHLKRRAVVSGLVAIAAVAIAVAVGTLWWPRPAQEVETTKPTRIVVLPFDNLGNPDDAYFADGITEEITSRLASIDGLQVISRSSANHYRNADKTIQQIGAELDVGYVLDGAVRWSRNPGDSGEVRITPQLIRVADDSHLWAEPFQRPVDDVFSIQAEIAAEVARRLELRLVEADQQRLETSPTSDPLAYQAYLRGRYLKHRALDPHNRELAVTSFGRAVDLDPDFALAWAELAEAHARMYRFRNDRTEERKALAWAAMERAQSLAPDHPRVHLALGTCYAMLERDFEASDAELAIAAQGLPNDSEVLVRRALRASEKGNPEEAISILNGAARLDPLDNTIQEQLGVESREIGRHAEADAYFDRAIELAPDHVNTYFLKVENLWRWRGALDETRATLDSIPVDHQWTAWYWVRQELYEGNLEAALERATTLSSRPVRAVCEGVIYLYMGDEERLHATGNELLDIYEPQVAAAPDNPDARLGLSAALGALGRWDEALEQSQLAVELSADNPSKQKGYLTSVAQLRAWRGELDAAFDIIESLLSGPQPALYVSFLQMDPIWAPLRDHPRFAELVEKYGPGIEQPAADPP